GHIRAVLNDGRVVEERQLHFRGGAHEPLARADIEEKFVLNVRHGGWDDKRAASALRQLAGLYNGKIDLAFLRG
ncbi:MAG: MmgE/PrpD family protein, partial [Pseudolabrys sp.]